MRVYNGNPLLKDVGVLRGMDQWPPVATPPPLVILSIDKVHSLSTTPPEAGATLQTFFDAMPASSHPTGTVAVAVPRL